MKEKASLRCHQLTQVERNSWAQRGGKREREREIEGCEIVKKEKETENSESRHFDYL